MSSPQFLLLLGAILIFSNLVITHNRTSMSQALIVYENESFIYAKSLGQSLLEEMETRDFDENTINDGLSDPEGLTDPGNLTSESGENSMDKFDDIDDFNGFVFVDPTSGHGDYNCTPEVYYVDQDYPDTKESTKFFSKRVDIVITNQYLLSEITMSRIYSY